MTDFELYIVNSSVRNSESIPIVTKKNPGAAGIVIPTIS